MFNIPQDNFKRIYVKDIVSIIKYLEYEEKVDFMDLNYEMRLVEGRLMALKKYRIFN